MFVVQVPGTITDTSLPQPGIADPLLNGAPAGSVRALFDLAAVTSWAKQAAPANSDPVVDLAAAGFGNGSVAVSGTVPPAFAGGGFDFTGVTAKPNSVIGPAGSLATIKAAANQYFCVCTYLKLPTLANWNSTAGIQPFFVATAGGSGYATPEADLLTICSTNRPAITARRQKDGGSTLDNVSLSEELLTPHYGLVTQLAFWRNGTNQTLQATSSAGTTSSTLATGTNNTGDFSAQAPRWGVTNSFSSIGVWNSWRLYRGWVEDLSISGRTPATVLSADYASVAARFS